MKIKNLAFFGIMAAILGVNGAARADSTTIIASQAYVDAKDALKQDEDKRYENTLTTYNGLGKTADQQKEDYPSMYTLKEAISDVNTSISNNVTNNAYTANALDSTAQQTANKAKLAKVEAIQNTAERKTSGTVTQWTASSTDDKLPTVAAVGQQLDKFASDNSTVLNSGIDSTKVAQITTNANNISTNTGNITANTSAIEALNKAIEKGLTAEQETAYNDWIDPEKGNREIKTTEGSWWMKLQTALATDVDNVVSDYQKEHQNLIPRNRNIQKGIAYLKGNGIEHYTPGVNTNPNDATAGISNSTVARQAELAWKENYLVDKGDDYVPTVAAVERRVLEAEAAAITAAGTNLKDTTDAATTAEGATKLTVNDGDDDHFYTADAVEAGFTAVNDAIGNMALTAAGASTASSASTDAVVEVTQLDGKIAVKTGKLTAAALDSTAKATSGSGNNNLGSATNAVDTKLVTEKAVADALNGKANAQTVTNDDTNANSLVTVNSQGVVTGKIAAGALAKKNAIGNSDVTGNSLEYKDTMNYALSNVDTTGGEAQERCTLKSPCTLTMIWSNGKPVYEWTNMDTEDTSALL